MLLFLLWSKNFPTWNDFYYLENSFFLLLFYRVVCEGIIFYISFFWHKVEPNQEFQGLVCEGANVLPSKFIEDAFRDGYGLFSVTFPMINLSTIFLLLL